jgi:hypothetical protein
MTGFGMAHIRREGAPVHPADFYWECECQGCLWRWERQLREWADSSSIDPPEIARDYA